MKTFRHVCRRKKGKPSTSVTQRGQQGIQRAWWTITASDGINVCLRKFDPTKIFDLIRQHGVTHMAGAPIVYNTLINAPDAPKDGAARHVVGLLAGAAPPVAVLEGAESIGIKLPHDNGLTEVYGPASVCV